MFTALNFSERFFLLHLAALLAPRIEALPQLRHGLVCAAHLEMVGPGFERPAPGALEV